jgi:hypothetical protein
MAVNNSRSHLQNSILKINQASEQSLQLEEIPSVAPISTKRPNITLHHVRRVQKLREIDIENAKFAKKLMFVNSSIPARKSLNKEF